MPSPSSTRTPTTPPRGRQVDAAVETANPLGDNRCGVANSLTFGAVDVSWMSPLRNVTTIDNENSC